jgi:hypothetical protein
MDLITVSGSYRIQRNSIRVVTSADICKYYRHLFNKAHYNIIKTQTPAHGGHVNIISPKLHNIDCTIFNDLHNTAATFQLDISGNYGGFRKGFLNFWFDCYSDDFYSIKDFLGIPRNDNGFADFHLTILNTKNI